MTAVVPKQNFGKSWAVTICQVLGSSALGIGMFKAMTTYMLIMVYFAPTGLTPEIYGGVTGVISLLALTTSIPGGMLIAKIGAANLAKLCMLLFIIGYALSCAYLLALGRSADFVVMTVLGAVTTIGGGAMPVAGTTLVSAWFPPKKRPLPMGCCGMFVPVSLIIVQYLSSPIIAMASTEGFTADEIAACFGQSPAGFVTFTVAITIYAIIVCIIAMVVIRNPKPQESFLGVTAATENTGGGQQEFSDGSWKEGFTNIGVWLMVIVFCCYSFGSTCYANYWPTYVESAPAQGGFMIDPATVNMMTTAVTYSMIAVSLIVGYLLTKVHRDYWWILILICAIAICFNGVFLFLIPFAGFIVPFLIFYGCLQELWPCTTYTLVPEMVDTPKGLGTALGLVSFTMSFAGTICSAIAGVIIGGQGLTQIPPTGSWNALATLTGTGGVIALIAGIGALFYWRKRWATLKARAAALEAQAAAQA